MVAVVLPPNQHIPDKYRKSEMIERKIGVLIGAR
jgi:hypothetical protein